MSASILFSMLVPVLMTSFLRLEADGRDMLELRYASIISMKALLLVRLCGREWMAKVVAMMESNLGLDETLNMSSTERFRLLDGESDGGDIGFNASFGEMSMDASDCDDEEDTGNSGMDDERDADDDDVATDSASSLELS